MAIRTLQLLIKLGELRRMRRHLAISASMSAMIALATRATERKERANPDFEFSSVRSMIDWHHEHLLQPTDAFIAPREVISRSHDLVWRCIDELVAMAATGNPTPYRASSSQAVSLQPLR